jgi:hypothetical protein
VVALAAPIEETLSTSSGAPMEVLRLVVLDGVMELRFCGARVQLRPPDDLTRPIERRAPATGAIVDHPAPAAGTQGRRLLRIQAAPMTPRV